MLVNRDSAELREPHLVQTLLSALNDVRVQIPRRDFASAFEHSMWIVQRSYHVQQNDLRLKANEPSRLLRAGDAGKYSGTVRQRHRNKNSMHVHHGASSFVPTGSH